MDSKKGPRISDVRCPVLEHYRDLYRTVLPTSRTRIPIMGVTDIRYQQLMLLRDTNNNMCVLDNPSRRTL